MTSPSILIVDDDPKLREVVRYALVREGFEVAEAEHGVQALGLLEHSEYALLVLDVSMPELDGLDLCREIRRTCEVPILFLSARAEEMDRVLGLEIGGDDYLTKPFSPRELVSRVKAILRRFAKAARPPVAARNEELRRNRLRLSPQSHRVWVDDQEVGLTATEFRLLQALLAHPTRVYPRDELSERAYEDGRVVSGRTVDSHVRHIRAKFAVYELDPIETVHGVGYRLR